MTDAPKKKVFRHEAQFQNELDRLIGITIEYNDDGHKITMSSPDKLVEWDLTKKESQELYWALEEVWAYKGN